MTDYTPTTEHVLKSWLHDGRMSSEFRLWLAEVKAQAWEEGFQDGHDSAMGVRNTDNPYRQGEEQ